MVTSEQIQECITESSCILRTPDSYFEQCSLLEGVRAPNKLFMSSPLLGCANVATTVAKRTSLLPICSPTSLLKVIKDL